MDSFGSTVLLYFKKEFYEDYEKGDGLPDSWKCAGGTWNEKRTGAGTGC